MYGDIKTKYKDMGAVSSVNTNYMILEDIFKNIYINYNDSIFVDIGCGKGRVFSYLRLFHKCKKMVGIELDEDVAQFTRKWTSKFKNIEVIQGNVLDHFYAEGDVYYLFNPFDSKVLDEFLERVEKSCKEGSILIYCNIDVDHAAVFSKRKVWKLEGQFVASTKYVDVKNEVYPVKVFRLKNGVYK